MSWALLRTLRSCALDTQLSSDPPRLLQMLSDADGQGYTAASDGSPSKHIGVQPATLMRGVFDQVCCALRAITRGRPSISQTSNFCMAAVDCNDNHVNVHM